jgi:hypothetical protein
MSWHRHTRTWGSRAVTATVAAFKEAILWRERGLSTASGGRGPAGTEGYVQPSRCHLRYSLFFVFIIMQVPYKPNEENLSRLNTKAGQSPIPAWIPA